MVLTPRSLLVIDDQPIASCLPAIDKDQNTESMSTCHSCGGVFTG